MHHLRVTFFGLIFLLAGWASIPAPNSENHPKVSVVYLNPKIDVSHEMYYMGPGTALGFAFGAVGGEIAGTANEKPGDEFRQFAELGAFRIAQLDAAFMGGMEQFIATARMFDARGMKIATHSWGAGVAQMQNIHAAFAAPNTIILEIPPAAGPLHTELWGDSFVMQDGYVLPPTAPGLGVRLTDEIKAKFPFVPGSGEFNSVPGKILRE